MVLADELNREEAVQLEVDDQAKLELTDEVITFQKIELEDGKKLAKAAPVIRQGEKSKLKVSFINHKFSEGEQRVNLNLDASLIVETSKDQEGHFLSISNLSNCPLQFFEVDPNVASLPDTVFGATFLQRGPDSGPILLVGKKDNLYFVTDLEDHKDSKISNNFLGDKTVIADRSSDATYMTTLPMSTLGLTADVAIKNNKLSIITYKPASGKSTNIEVPEAAVTNKDQVSSAEMHTIGDRSILAILTVGGVLVVKDSSIEEKYQVLKLPASREYRYAFFSKETSSFYVLAASSNQGSTKVSIYQVGCPAEQALSKEVSVAEFSVDESSSNGLKFGGVLQGGKPVFLLIFGNGRMYKVQDGSVKKDDVLCNTKDARVVEIRPFEGRDKKVNLYVVLESPSNTGPVRVHTIARIQLS